MTEAERTRRGLRWGAWGVALIALAWGLLSGVRPALAFGLAQLGVLIGAGSFGPDRIVASTVALAATLAMIPLGARVRSRMAGDAFEKAILILLVFSGVSLLWRAIG